MGHPSQISEAIAGSVLRIDPGGVQGTRTSCMSLSALLQPLKSMAFPLVLQGGTWLQADWPPLAAWSRIQILCLQGPEPPPSFSESYNRADTGEGGQELRPLL